MDVKTDRWAGPAISNTFGHRSNKKIVKRSEVELLFTLHLAKLGLFFFGAALKVVIKFFPLSRKTRVRYRRKKKKLSTND